MKSLGILDTVQFLGGDGSDQRKGQPVMQIEASASRPAFGKCADTFFGILSFFKSQTDFYGVFAEAIQTPVVDSEDLPIFRETVRLKIFFSQLCKRQC